MKDLSRLLRPRSIAVVGGGEWGKQVVRQSRHMGFAGDIFRVHPSPDAIEGVPAVASLAELPYPPDATFLGINRRATLDAVGELAAMGAGGAVCFASGFAEAQAEDADSATLQSALVAAARDMPFLGPNCYGFVNAVDRALLWPDQHGCAPVDRGVALVTQSSNIAINLTMQKRGLPIAYAVTCGNMAQTSQAEIAMALLDDPRVTAIGLHVEGFGDTHAWHAFARKANDQGVPVVALKIGASEQARAATITHTASLAGSDAGADALLDYLGVARVHDLPTLLECLMLLHCNGPLDSSALSSISCSGGEASLVADAATGSDVHFPPLTQTQRSALSDALGPMVALANPLDYHTYIWGDPDRMAAAWLPMTAKHIGLTMAIVDYPHTDASAWHCATTAAIKVRQSSGRPMAVVSTLSELMPPDVAHTLISAGVTPLHGLNEALGAAAAAARIVAAKEAPPLRPAADGARLAVTETEGKSTLQQFGVPVPAHVFADQHTLRDSARSLTAPLVLKGQGLAHKSEAGAVRLNLTPESVEDAAVDMPGDGFLIEEMVQGALCELLVGVTSDPAHGYLLTVAAGGVLTELWQDRCSLLLPATREDVETAVQSLRIFPLLRGYRGAPAANLPAVLDAIMALQDFVVAHAETLCEVEINPLMCTAHEAVAADVLIVYSGDPTQSGETDGPG